MQMKKSGGPKVYDVCTFYQGIATGLAMWVNSCPINQTSTQHNIMYLAQVTNIN